MTMHTAKQTEVGLKWNRLVFINIVDGLSNEVGIDLCIWLLNDIYTYLRPFFFIHNFILGQALRTLI